VTVIEVSGLTFTYAGNLNPAVRGIDLSIPEGQLFAIVGPNAAGKSTLCYALTGFIPHFFNGELEGTVQVAGRSVRDTPLGELAGSVGLVFQNPFSQISGARFSVREEVAFGLENLGIPRPEMAQRIEQALALTGLDGLADRSPYALSGGQQQRLAIASMIVMRPQVLVLDEPTSQLDPAGTREVFAALRSLTAERQMTVVVVEHKLEWVATFADRVLLLSGGQAVAMGDPRQVLASPQLEAHGVDPTRYSRAARQAQRRGLAPAGALLPVTLAQAAEFFG
jgi:energy-coupling factor transport system ATP-binding protein